MSQLGELQPTDLDLERQRLRLPARRKGRGADALWVPLLPQAVQAFTDFAHYSLWGPFSQHSLRHSWVRACKRANVQRSRPYDLRHAFGALVYRATQSREAVQQLLQHANWATSARYAMSAEAEVLAAHGERLVQHSGTTEAGLQRIPAESSGAIQETESQSDGEDSSETLEKLKD